MGEDLRRRVEQLEEVAHLRPARGARTVRYRSAAAIGDIPLLAVSVGPDLERGELRGHARGIIAIGDMATGVIAVGGLARGLIALGGLAAGGVTFGGLSLGLLAALGGMAAGSVAVGGAAVGRVAIGGGAYGRYACGGAAGGTYVISEQRRDPEAAELFRRHGLDRLCRK